MSRGSRHRVPLPAMELYLTAGGWAELVAPELSARDDGADDVVWDSRQDEDFQAHFGARFLFMDDVADILKFLVDANELSKQEADDCEVLEEFADVPDGR